MKRLRRVGARPRAILDRGQDMRDIGPVVGRQLGRLGPAIGQEGDQRRRGAGEHTQEGTFGGGRVGKDDEAGGVVDPLDLEATAVILPVGKDELDISRLELLVEVGEEQDPGDRVRVGGLVEVVADRSRGEAGGWIDCAKGHVEVGCRGGARSGWGGVDGGDRGMGGGGEVVGGGDGRVGRVQRGGLVVPREGVVDLERVDHELVHGDRHRQGGRHGCGAEGCTS